MGKHLILDKSVFHGTSQKTLLKFTKRHAVILSDTLFTESLTSTKLDSQRYITLIRKMILEGAKASYGILHLIREEMCNFRPCDSIINHKVTESIRNESTKNEDMFDNNEIFDVYQQNLSLALIVPKIAKLIKQNTLTQYTGIEREMKKSKASPEELFSAATDWATTKIFEAKQIFFSNLVEDLDRFCTSDKWITWHYLRGVLTLAHIYFWKDVGYSGAWGNKNLRKYYNDMEYIILLYEADGLLTSDNDCASLAKLMFPAKVLFWGIEEVPEEYICHWS
jgi:hypothetical protein